MRSLSICVQSFASSPAQPDEISSGVRTVSVEATLVCWWKPNSPREVATACEPATTSMYPAATKSPASLALRMPCAAASARAAVVSAPVES